MVQGSRNVSPRLGSLVSPLRSFEIHRREEGGWRPDRACASSGQSSFCSLSHSFQRRGLRRSWPESHRERRSCAGVPSRTSPRSVSVATSGSPSGRGREGVSWASLCGSGSWRFSMSPRVSSSPPDRVGSPSQETIWLVTLARLSLSSVLTPKQPERFCMQVSRRCDSVR